MKSATLVQNHEAYHATTRVESQTPTRAHHEQRRDVALQRATRRQRKPEPRYVEPPPGTPPPPDGDDGSPLT